jgi:hypothetical protein
MLANPHHNLATIAVTSGAEWPYRAIAGDAGWTWPFLMWEVKGKGLALQKVVKYATARALFLLPVRPVSH